MTIVFTLIHGPLGQQTRASGSDLVVRFRTQDAPTFTDNDGVEILSV